MAQVAGAIVASFVLYLIASGKPGFDLVASGFAANGYGEHSPGGYSLFACLVAEVVLTYIFLLVILGATDSRAPAGFAGLAIGLVLTLIHLVDIPVTNASVNPARSTGPALFVGVGPCSNSGFSGWPHRRCHSGWAYLPLAVGESRTVSYQLMRLMMGDRGEVDKGLAPC